MLRFDDFLLVVPAKQLRKIGHLLHYFAKFAKRLCVLLCVGVTQYFANFLCCYLTHVWPTKPFSLPVYIQVCLTQTKRKSSKSHVRQGQWHRHQRQQQQWQPPGRFDKVSRILCRHGDEFYDQRNGNSANSLLDSNTQEESTNSSLEEGQSRKQ